MVEVWVGIAPNDAINFAEYEDAADLTQDDRDACPTGEDVIVRVV